VIGLEQVLLPLVREEGKNNRKTFATRSWNLGKNGGGPRVEGNVQGVTSIMVETNSGVKKPAARSREERREEK